MKRISILVLVVIGISSCSKRGPNKEVKLSGINGEAYYHFDNDTKEVVLVFKKDYVNFTDYAITIKKDTLKLNEDLSAHFSVDHPNFKVVIEKPTTQVLIGSVKDPAKSPLSSVDDYKFKANEEGLFELVGHLEYDTVVVPFVYKFLVVK